jgi:methionyl-tRNA synthetase
MDANRVQEGAAQLVALASAANRYVEETAPYKLAKQPERAAQLDSVLANLARTVGRLAVLAQPFVPTTAEIVWGTLGPLPSQPLTSVRLRDLDTLDLAGRRILKPPILFPKPRAAHA